MTWCTSIHVMQSRMSSWQLHAIALKRLGNHWMQPNENIPWDASGAVCMVDHDASQSLHQGGRGWIYAEYNRKEIRPKKVQIALNVVLGPEDTPDLPDPRKQKFYCSFVAKLQFAATWVRFDITFAVSQLARFCASAGSSHWAALHHLMEYFAGTP